jgi:hypothetical protein
MPVLSKSVGTSEPERDCEVQKLLPSSTRQLHKRLLRLFYIFNPTAGIHLRIFDENLFGSAQANCLCAIGRYFNFATPGLVHPVAIVI